MKTIELRRQSATNGDPKGDETSETVILTYGEHTIAAMLPNAANLIHLAKFEQLISEEETVTLTLNSKPIAILQTLVPLVLINDESADLESVSLSTNAQFLNIIENARQRQETEGGISSAEMRKRLDI